jgi:hypothetical protein
MTVTTAALIALLNVMPFQPAAFKSSASPVSDAVREQETRGESNLVASAELMPADKYGFHPTEPQMTFGQLIVHVVQSNMALCSGIAGVASPLTQDELMKLAGTQPKDTLVSALKRSFDFCRESLAKMTDAQLADEVSVVGRRTGLSRAAAMVAIAADWADHYSTAASYLRQNGILPPTAPPK